VNADVTIYESAGSGLKQTILSWEFQTALVLAVPASVTSSTQAAYLIDSYDQQLQDISTGKVRLRIPLNTELRLMKVGFIKSYTLDTVMSEKPFGCSSGLSDPFLVKADQEGVSVQIIMKSVPPGAVGQLYTGFDQDGIAVNHNAAGGNGDDFGLAADFDSSGRLLVSGYSKGTADMDMALWGYDTDGNLDTTFNSTGYLTQDGDAGATAINGEMGHGLVLDSSKRILVTGGVWNSTEADLDMAIWRYHADGIPDTSFGTAGHVRHHNAAGGNSGDLARGIAVDSAGRIVIVGYSYGSGSNYDMVVWRYLENGTLDTAFDGDGFLTHNDAAGGNDHDYAYAVAIDTSDRIVVTGKSANGANDDMVLWRFDISGNLEASFGTGGIVIHNGAAGGNGDDRGHQVVLDGNGRIIVAGYSYNGTDLDMALWRYNTDGSLDSTFGSGGVVVFNNPYGGDDKGNALVLDAAGKIVVAGIVKTGALGDMALWRFNSDGSADSGFGNSGYVTHDAAAGGDGDEEINFASFNNRDNGIAIGPSGRIYVTGTSKNGAGNKDMVIWSYE